MFLFGSQHGFPRLIANFSADSNTKSRPLKHPGKNPGKPGLNLRRSKSCDEVNRNRGPLLGHDSLDRKESCGWMKDADENKTDFTGIYGIWEMGANRTFRTYTFLVGLVKKGLTMTYNKEGKRKIHPTQVRINPFRIRAKLFQRAQRFSKKGL